MVYYSDDRQNKDRPASVDYSDLIMLKFTGKERDKNQMEPSRLILCHYTQYVLPSLCTNKFAGFCFFCRDFRTCQTPHLNFLRVCLILPIKGFRVIASSVSSPDILSGSLVSCSFILLPQTAGETKFLSRMVFSCFEASVYGY